MNEALLSEEGSENIDPALLEKLFTDHYARLIVYAYSIVGDKEFAHDLVMDCFLKVARKGKEFSSIENVIGYLNVAVKNTCLNHLEKTDTHNYHHQRMLLAADKSNDTTSSTIELKDVIRCIQEFGRQYLSPTTWEVVNLYAKGFSNKEIALQLNMHEKRVSEHKTKGLKILRQFTYSIIGIIILLLCVFL